MSDKKKFFFDRHNFDENAEEEEGPPPPPTFSEEELASAKDTSYQKGKQDGFQDSQASLEKKIEVLLEHAKKSFLDFQSKEAAREKQYEEEAVHLALTVFKSIFPAWVEQQGPAEVEKAIADVLQSASNHQSIRIEVATAMLSATEARFKPITESLSDISISFHGRDDLSETDMRMKWENGGAVRDSQQLSAQILQSLTKELPQQAPEETQEDLADNEEKRHNKSIETETPDE